jgi:hypothetical protein
VNLPRRRRLGTSATSIAASSGHTPLFAATPGQLSAAPAFAGGVLLRYDAAVRGRFADVARPAIGGGRAGCRTAIVCATIRSARLFRLVGPHHRGPRGAALCDGGDTRAGRRIAHEVPGAVAPSGSALTVRSTQPAPLRSYTMTRPPLPSSKRWMPTAAASPSIATSVTRSPGAKVKHADSENVAPERSRMQPSPWRWALRPTRPRRSRRTARCRRSRP